MREQRVDLGERLRAALEAEPWVQSAWVGGSAAFGRDDDRSDLDLQLLVDDGREDDAFALVERALAAGWGIRAVWHVPDAPVAAFRQRFYQLVGLPESLMVDLCVMRRDRLGPFLDPTRHGRPVVWFDRVAAVVPADDPAIAEALARRMDQVRQRFALLAHIPEKELARGRIVEAVDTYFRHLLTPLVEVLRARYSPRRQDYGFRYVRDDLPPEVVDELEALMLPDRDTLPDDIAAARAWLARELAQR